MTDHTGQVGYWCTVLAEGFPYGAGETVPYVLSTFHTTSPILALRWLQDQGCRIADRLDPDPERSTWVQPWMRTDMVPVPDCPAELRFWATSPKECQSACDQLEAGAPLSVVIPDSGCHYTFAAWAVAVPPPTVARPMDGRQSAGPRPGGRGRRKARRKAFWLIPLLTPGRGRWLRRTA